MRKLLTCLVAAALLPLWLRQPPAQADDFNRRAMLENIADNVILPYHQTFLDRTAALQEAANTFRDAPDLDHLQALREVWRETSLAWAGCQLFRFEKLMLLHNAVAKYPPSAKLIEGFISDEDEINEVFIERVGSTSKGIPAIEYLIFDPQRSDDEILTSFTDERRMAYLVSLAENLHSKAGEIYDFWSPDGDDYAATFSTSDGEGLRESLSMLLNEMVVFLEDILHTKLGDPLGNSSGGDPRPDKVESYQLALPQIIANVESFQRAFTGGDGLGLDDYLGYLGAQTLSDDITAQIETALSALTAIKEPLDQAVVDQTEAVQGAYEAVRGIMILVRVDMAAQLGVTITFSDNDGD